MRKLALDDKLLLSIDKPARYTGGEVNSVYKDPAKVDIRFAMCFPDVYEIGMSHLGIQVLYHMLNSMEDVWCERVYSPWVDLDKIMRERKIPLFALESQDPIQDFDFLGITLQYEMCYTNILQVLELSQIPLLAAERGEEHPIVIGGGPCAYNPEPLADFFDLFYIGEGEISYRSLLTLFKENKAAGGTRADFLRQAATVPGIYVPSLYQVVYHDDGTIASFIPTCPEAPARIRKVIVGDMTAATFPDKPVVPYIKVTQDRVVLEIMRGCIRGCRFCQAGMVYRPVRERSLERLEQLAMQMLDTSGHEEISLSSLSSSDYSGIAPLVTGLMEDCSRRKVNISLPSLRIDAFSLDVMSKVQDVKKSSLTFAPEAGTQRLRNVINKGLTEDDILSGAASAFRGGWNKVKLYFMLGLPTETEEDMKGIALLSETIARRYYEEVPKEKRHGKVNITASASFFVPKPFTPFQWAAMFPKEEYLRRAYLVKDTFAQQLNHKSMHFQYHEADVTVLEGVLARGDRRVGAALLAAYRLGCLYDAWSDYFDNNKWMQAFAESGVDPDFYTLRERGAEETFPWDFIDVGVTKIFLRREWERAMQEQVTPNCRAACSGCGATVFGEGICKERRGERADGEIINDRNFQREHADLIKNEEISEGETGWNVDERNPQTEPADSGRFQESESAVTPKSEKPATLKHTPSTAADPIPHIKLRLRFAKRAEMRFIGHLDLMRYFQKCMRRADIDICYSQGFSPHQIMSFASPLGMGLTSEGEYMDIEVYSTDSSERMKERLNAVMTEGMEILSVVRLPEEGKTNAMATIAAASYEVKAETGMDGLSEHWQNFLVQPQIIIHKQTKKSETDVDIRPLIFHSQMEGNTFRLLLSAGSSENLKPEAVLEAFFRYRNLNPAAVPLQICRLDMYARRGNRLVSLEQLGEVIYE